MQHRLELKIAGIFFAIILVIIGSYFIAFRVIYMNHERKLMGEESLNTLQTMKSATISIIENADNYSKIILSDDDVQRVMRTGDVYSNLTAQSVIARRIYGLLQFAENIESVYLLDLCNQVYSVGEKENLPEGYIDVSRLAWYQRIMKKDGAYLLIPGEEGMVRSSGSNQISLIRTYKNIDDLQHLGFISVNIDINAFQSTYREILNEEQEEIMFLDERNQIVCRNGLEILQGEERVKFAEKLNQSKEHALSESIEIDEKKYMITGVGITREDWKIIRLFPVDMKQESAGIMTINIILVMLSAVLILCGTVWVSNMITRPIQIMLVSMKKAEEGKFEKISFQAFFNEFRYLFDGFNRMLEKIDLLLKQTVEKQKTIRKIELNEMQEQMKPHFLYNTLDSIEALILLGENDKAAEAVESLSDFYRKSVSKGRDMLTIKEEVEIVQDYIRIMKIRFHNLFEEKFVLDRQCLSFLIPKLTLQPLVENSIHHGLRERGKMGHLWIEILQEDEWVRIRIGDDGQGISEQVMEDLKQKHETYKGKSFGLLGTIERMQIIYGNAFRYEIVSRKMERTDIIFYIRKDALEEKREYGEIKDYSD